MIFHSPIFEGKLCYSKNIGEMESWNDDIEFAVYCLVHPEMRRGKEFCAWIKEPEHQILFEEVQQYHEAYLQHEDVLHIDVGEEYKWFVGCTKKLRRRKILRWTLSAAASVAVLVAVYFFVPKIEVDENTLVETECLVGRKPAELILASGERVILGSNIQDIASEDGKIIATDSCKHLSYRDVEREDMMAEKIPEYNTIQVPGGADYVVELADGTKVHLNCESELRYPVRFVGEERRVYLDGEAYFDVVKSVERPFIVETKQMQIEVTGTQFDVKAYAEDATMQTTLIEGGVKVCAYGKESEPVVLTPSQQYVLDVQTGQEEVKQVDVQLYIGWVEGMFVFKNQRLEDVMTMLARWYSVDVFYMSESVKDIRLSANLKRYDNIDSTLDVIQGTNKIDFMRNDNVVIVMKK